MSEKDIENLTGEVFDTKEELFDRQVFIDKLFSHPELGPMFEYFQKSYTESSKYWKSRAMELIHINQMLYKLIYEIVRNAVYSVEEPDGAK